MHPDITLALAREHQRALRQEAERNRGTALASGRRRSIRTPMRTGWNRWRRTRPERSLVVPHAPDVHTPTATTPCATC